SKLSFLFCCWYFRPSKPYFLVAVKWSVMQYVILRPIISLVLIITNSFNSKQHKRMAFHLFFTSNNPLKMFTAMNPLTSSHMESTVTRLLVATKQLLESLTDWSHGRIDEGGASDIHVRLGNEFNAASLAFSKEGIDMNLMIVIKGSGRDRTPLWSSFAHSQDYCNFFYDITSSIRFFIDRWRGKAYTSSPSSQQQSHALACQPVPELFFLLF
ncbi:hypothetical protein DFH28DRAFT_890191, partial [Melampsora americana]